MTKEEANKMIERAKGKANKFNAPVVLNIRYNSICLLRTFSTQRQADIQAGNENEIIIEPAR